MSVQAPSDALARATARLAQTPTPEASAEALVEACVELADAVSGELLLLDLRNGRLMPYPASAPSTIAGVKAGSFTASPSGLAPLRSFAPDVADEGDGVVVFGFRGPSCVGALVLLG